MKYNISNFINFKFFLISLSLGLFLNYINDPNQKVIYVYPTPDNIDKIQYKDYTDTCFTFQSQNVECPKDKNEITDIPVQHK